MIPGCRAITVCVEHHDVLALTLRYNMPNFESMTVITTRNDHKTVEVATTVGADVFQTDVFYERGAHFNKFAALEQGLDYMGRRGWICILDADIAIPQRRHEWEPSFGNIYTPRRRLLPSIPKQIPEERFWRRQKIVKFNEGFLGYFQMFHASDEVLRDVRHWHPTDITWCFGGDTFFSDRWPEHQRIRTPFEVLHIGPPFLNWAGRVTPYADGTIPELSEKRSGICKALLNARRGRRDGDRYLAEKIPK